jgi:hypothetical protein
MMHVIALLIAIISSSVPAKVKNSARAQAQEVADALVGAISSASSS